MRVLLGECEFDSGKRLLLRHGRIEPLTPKAFLLLEELADATLDGTRKAYVTDLTAAPLLIIDDLAMRKLPITAAEDLLEIIMRRHGRASTILTSNRPVEDWGKLLGDTPAVTAMLDRLLEHGYVLTCGPKSWRMKTHASLRREGQPQ